MFDWLRRLVTPRPPRRYDVPYMSLPAFERRWFPEVFHAPNGDPQRVIQRALALTFIDKRSGATVYERGAGATAHAFAAALWGAVYDRARYCLFVYSDGASAMRARCAFGSFAKRFVSAAGPGYALHTPAEPTRLFVPSPSFSRPDPVHLERFFGFTPWTLYKGHAEAIDEDRIVRPDLVIMDHPDRPGPRSSSPEETLHGLARFVHVGGAVARPPVRLLTTDAAVAVRFNAMLAQSTKEPIVPSYRDRMLRRTDHILLRAIDEPRAGADLVCAHCGAVERLAFPIPVSALVEANRRFTTAHVDCGPTPTPTRTLTPEAPQL